MAKKYIVDLNKDEKAALVALTQKGRPGARKIKGPRIIVGTSLLVALAACAPIATSLSVAGLPPTGNVAVPIALPQTARTETSLYTATSTGTATATMAETTTPTRIHTASHTPQAVPTATRIPRATRRPIPHRSPTQLPSTTFTATPAACFPTDQDQYVHDPKRLQVLAACLRVTGTIVSLEASGGDGDVHIRLRLDASYTYLLKPANISDQHGDLVVEPVCVHSPREPDIAKLCATDPAPFNGPWPAVGQHVWMEGRYVLDVGHSGWAELHPLYRWGIEP